jgi:hypothetical protein
MSSQGPNNCGTGVDSGSGGTAWNNPGNVAVSGQQANVNLLNGASSDFLNVTNFAFTFPTGANVTVNGITYSFIAASTGSLLVVDNAVFALKSSVQVGSNQATSSTWTGTRTFGSSSSLLGTTWLPTDISGNSGFGVSLQLKNSGISGSKSGFVTAFVTCTVYYTVVPTKFMFTGGQDN